MPDGQVLEFTRVTKRFNDVTAVSDLSARVEPGVVTAFLGPNGAGKTTTLRILLGQVRPTSGTATIGGTAYSELRHPLRTIGAVLEETMYRPRRTATRQLTIAAKANGIPLSRVDEVLSLVGLENESEGRIGSFSLGMRQRLSVAHALLGDPGALVFDEPANGLDPEGIRWMRLLMRRLADEGRTVLVSSHVLSEVEQVADHVLVLSKGQLVLSSGIEELADPSAGSVVVDAADRAALRSALSAAGFEVEVLRSGLTVRGGDAGTVGAVAADAGIALSTLVQRGPTLEDVFIDLVRGGTLGPRAQAAATQLVRPEPAANAGEADAEESADAEREAALETGAAETGAADAEGEASSETGAADAAATEDDLDDGSGSLPVASDAVPGDPVAAAALTAGAGAALSDADAPDDAAGHADAPIEAEVEVAEAGDTETGAAAQADAESGEAEADEPESVEGGSWAAETEAVEAESEAVEAESETVEPEVEAVEAESSDSDAAADADADTDTDAETIDPPSESEPEPEAEPQASDADVDSGDEIAEERDESAPTPLLPFGDAPAAPAADDSNAPRSEPWPSLFAPHPASDADASDLERASGEQDDASADSAPEERVPSFDDILFGTAPVAASDALPEEEQEQEQEPAPADAPAGEHSAEAEAGDTAGAAASDDHPESEDRIEDAEHSGVEFFEDLHETGDDSAEESSADEGDSVHEEQQETGAAEADDPRSAAVSSMLAAAARAYYEDEPKDYPLAPQDAEREGAHWSVASTGVVDTVPSGEDDAPARSDETADDQGDHEGEHREDGQGEHHEHHEGEHHEGGHGEHHEGEHHEDGHGEHHEHHEGEHRHH